MENIEVENINRENSSLGDYCDSSKKKQHHQCYKDYKGYKELIEKYFAEEFLVKNSNSGFGQLPQALKTALEEIIDLLDQGYLRVAEKLEKTVAYNMAYNAQYNNNHIDDNNNDNNIGQSNKKPNQEKNYSWQVNEWVKKALLLYINTNESQLYENKSNSFNDSKWFDKIPQKFATWKEEDFLSKNIRAVPGSFVRKSAFIAANVVLMPCFINIGSYIGAGSMIDTWATIGSSAQIGKNCHISGGVGIGGVLEPMQQTPVIIEDHCFIGARSEIAEGVIVGEGSVISMGCYIGASTKIVNKETEEVTKGYIPPYSVVIPGSLKYNEYLNTYCVIIIKTVDENTRKKTQINDLLR